MKWLMKSAVLFGGLIFMGCMLVYRQQPGGQAATSIDNGDTSPVLMKTNKITITNSEVQQLCDEFLREQNITDETVSEIARQQVLEHLSDQMLIISYAESLRLDETPEFIHRKKSAERELLVEYTLEKKVYADITLTDEEISNYYFRNQESYTIPARVQVRHILTRTREDAEKALERLRSSADFALVARELSIHSSRAVGGNLPPFSRGTYDANFEEVAFKLRVGEVSDIVPSSLGYHIIEKTGESPSRVIPLEEVRDEIRKKLLEDKKKAAYLKFLEKLRRDTFRNVRNE